MKNTQSIKNLEIDKRLQALEMKTQLKYSTPDLSNVDIILKTQLNKLINEDCYIIQKNDMIELLSSIRLLINRLQ